MKQTLVRSILAAALVDALAFTTTIAQAQTDHFDSGSEH